MGTSLETIRRITIQGGGQQSLDSLAASVDKVTAAEGRLATASGQTATVTDISAKRQLSAADAYKRQTLTVDEAARAQDRFTRAKRVADSALQQGTIDTDQHAARVDLLKEKYLEASDGTKAFGMAANFARAAFAPLVSLMSAQAVIGFGTSIFNNAAALNEQAEQAGANVEAFQARNAVMRDSGIAFDQAAAAQARLTRSTGEALAAAGPAREAFQQLGVSAATLRGGLDETMPAVAAALLQIPDTSERARLEFDLFGKSGQRLESALRALSAPTADLIEQQRALGQVLGGDVTTAADQADDRLSRAWKHMQNAGTPTVVGLTAAFAGLIDKLAEAIELQKKYRDIAYGDGQPELGAPYGPSAAGVITPKVTSDRSGFNAKAMSDALATQAQLNSIVGETGAKRAADLAIMTLGEKALIDQGKTHNHILNTLQAEIEITNALVAAHGERGIKEAQILIASTRNNAELKITTAAYDHLKETFGGYLAQLDQAAVATGLSTTEQQMQAAIIKAAQIDEKAHLVAAKNLSQTYADAVQHLTAEQQMMVRSKLALADVNAVQRDLNQQISDAIILGQTTLPLRAEEAAYLALSARYGKEVADAARETLATQFAIKDASAARDQVNARDTDIARLKDLQSLRGTPGIDNNRLNQAMNDNSISRDLSGLDQSYSGDFGKGDNIRQQDSLKAVQAQEDARKAIIKDALNATLIDQQGYQDRLLLIEQASARARAQIDQQLTQERLGMASDFFGNLATLSQSSNKTLSAIGKAAAITQATIDGILAVQKALASYPPPLNYVMAAGVGVAAAVNVAKISGIGFEDGGYTGGMPRNAVAGVVHGQEWVTHARATPGNVGTLEAMNNGVNFDRMLARFAAAPANSTGKAPTINIIHDGSTRVVVERTSESEIRIIAKQEAIGVAHSPEGDKAIARHLKDRNSRASEEVDNRRRR